MNALQKDEIRLMHILDSIKKIKSFSKGINEVNFLKNQLVQSAVERQLEIIGEAAAKLSDAIKEKYNHVEWQKIKAFRNIIAHEYFGLSKIQVWTVINSDIPELKKEIQKILKEEF